LRHATNMECSLNRRYAPKPTDGTGEWGSDPTGKLSKPAADLERAEKPPQRGSQ